MEEKISPRPSGQGSVGSSDDNVAPEASWSSPHREDLGDMHHSPVEHPKNECMLTVYWVSGYQHITCMLYYLTPHDSPGGGTLAPCLSPHIHRWRNWSTQPQRTSHKTPRVVNGKAGT